MCGFRLFVAPLNAALLVAARRVTTSSDCVTSPTTAGIGMFQGCWKTAGIATLSPMSVHPRQGLPHEIPLWVDPSKETYFITINCAGRGRNQLARVDIAEPLFDTVRHRQEKFRWWPCLFLLMPDHLHALPSYPASGKPPRVVIGKSTEWTAKQLGIDWQYDFFEHRLRREESRREKADYILANPVRAGLVSRPEDWSFVYFGDGQRPKFTD